MTEVSIRDLRNNLTRYLRRVECGERITVTRRGKPVATIQAEVEAENESDADAALWRMVREGKLIWSGGKFEGPKKRIALRGEGPTMSEMILEDRR